MQEDVIPEMSLFTRSQRKRRIEKSSMIWKNKLTSTLGIDFKAFSPCERRKTANI
jgi:hypothetical protein